MIRVEPVTGCPGVRCFLCDDHRPATTKIRGDGPSVFATLLICDVCRQGLLVALSPVVDPGQVGGAPVGRRHPDTSRKAAATVRVGSQLSALLGLMCAEDRPNATCAEVQPLLAYAVGHPVSRNQTAARMGELRDRGLVAFTGRLRPTENGNEATVWEPTDLGRAEYARLTA